MRARSSGCKTCSIPSGRVASVPGGTTTTCGAACFCGECGGRLTYARPKGNGGTYEYFVCGGRMHGSCSQGYHRAAAVEAAVERYYGNAEVAQLSEAERDGIRQAVRAYMVTSPRKRMSRSRRQRPKLLDLPGRSASCCRRITPTKSVLPCSLRNRRAFGGSGIEPSSGSLTSALTISASRCAGGRARPHGRRPPGLPGGRVAGAPPAQPGVLRQRLGDQDRGSCRWRVGGAIRQSPAPQAASRKRKR